jgi:hypothetical protein
MTSWSAGRVVLTGDAAWCPSPASGAGAELALVGAYRLAGELAAASGHHRPAFTRYDAALRPLVAARQQIGPNLRLMVPRTEGGRRVRNALAHLPLMKTASAVAPCPGQERPPPAGVRPGPIELSPTLAVNGAARRLAINLREYRTVRASSSPPPISPRLYPPDSSPLTCAGWPAPLGLAGDRAGRAWNPAPVRVNEQRVWDRHSDFRQRPHTRRSALTLIAVCGRLPAARPSP